MPIAQSSTEQNETALGIVICFHIARRDMITKQTIDLWTRREDPEMNHAARGIDSLQR
jgi:hypothetical protein